MKCGSIIPVFFLRASLQCNFSQLLCGLVLLKILFMGPSVFHKHTSWQICPEKKIVPRGPLLWRCFALFAAKPQAFAWAARSVG
jgi:hypothetical protein